MPAILFKLGEDGNESPVLDKVEESSGLNERLVGVTDRFVGVIEDGRRVEEIFMSSSNSFRRLALQRGVGTCSTAFRFSTSISYASLSLE